MRRVGSDERGRTLVNKSLHFITAPPGLGDVMIRQKTSVADQESGAKHVKLEWRSVPSCLDRHRPGAVRLRLSVGIRGDANQVPGIFVVKLHHHVQQADARSVRVDNRFRDSPLILKVAQAGLRLLKLRLEGCAIRVAAIRYFLPQLFALRLQSLPGSAASLAAGGARACSVRRSSSDCCTIPPFSRATSAWSWSVSLRRCRFESTVASAARSTAALRPTIAGISQARHLAPMPPRSASTAVSARRSFSSAS